MDKPEIFKEKVEKWADEIGVTPKEVHIREMKNKWASCSTKGRLTFARDLLDKPEEKQKEVIIHELLHLRYPDHGKMFKAMLNKYLYDTNHISG